ncbi:prepilin-type N-terminal cleavage/methylation domain-containing protein [Tepidibacillus infernus]|uniref:Prepilin-type N-terminal cleavage/methylation domain-containing protein n=1 Tax=Tepidibacillus decaturensis TaxID=1413211 RepID=A0A135L256_9BACI|nr:MULTISPECIES: prepilin-type N-terminal cleavage/methylation domain-containing protein [Tepidibacillus]KXG43046.1 hypothetical protein U473_02670 [Tepidibacillus decaturensis]GBF10817.1 hypothetical protein HK1_00831 [Tepidibacillus sp. HK-1]
MKNQYIQNQKGITLIELLAAITILAIIIIPVFQLLGYSYSSYIDDLRKVKAISLAQKYMEEAKIDSKMAGVYTDESYKTQVEVSKNNQSKLDQIKVSVYWQNIDPNQRLTFLMTEVRDPK